MGRTARQWCDFRFHVPPRCGWHRHHLLPTHVLHFPDLHRYLSSFADPELWLGDFRRNGMFLPSDERIAQRECLPLHRGPHRVYNDIVIETLDGLRQRFVRAGTSIRIQMTAVNGLQRNLRTLLRLSARNADIALGSRDPFGSSSALSAIDRQTDLLFVQAMQDHLI